MNLATIPAAEVETKKSPRVKFDRHELAGAFGDLGTDLPLIVGILLATGLDSAGVLFAFGLMQVLTGLRYGLPMPVQPLKAMAALVIAQKISGDLLLGGGLAIGIVMAILVVTGLIDWLARVVPKIVVRGIQFGLGLQLAGLALKNYVPSDGAVGYGLAAVCFLAAIFLRSNRRLPAALLIVGLGLAYGAFTKLHWTELGNTVGFQLPHPHVPTLQDIGTGFLLLALPQIPLSLGNSLLATKQIAQDLFPERRLSIRQIGWTYALMEFGQSVRRRRPDMSRVRRHGRALCLRRTDGWFGRHLRDSLRDARAVL